MGAKRKTDRLKRFENYIPLSPKGKMSFAALGTLCFLVAIGGRGLETAESQPSPPEDKPPVAIMWEGPFNQPQLLEAITFQLEPDPYREDIPLDQELQAVLREACADSGVPVALALGLIEEESHFQLDAVSGKGAYGLCQLNPKYFPADLDPAENIRTGVAWLGKLLESYEDTAAALRVYNLGYDDGDRQFADAVLAAAEKWEG